MMSTNLLGAIDERLQQIALKVSKDKAEAKFSLFLGAQRNIPFAGFSIILVLDFHQRTAIGGRKAYLKEVFCFIIH